MTPAEKLARAVQLVHRSPAPWSPDDWSLWRECTGNAPVMIHVALMNLARKVLEETK